MTTESIGKQVGLKDIAAENERLAAQVRDLRDKVIATTENDAQLRFRFATDKALQDRFSGESAYLAYMHDQARIAESPSFQRQLKGGV